MKLLFYILVNIIFTFSLLGLFAVFCSWHFSTKFYNTLGMVILCYLVNDKIKSVCDAFKQDIKRIIK